MTRYGLLGVPSSAAAHWPGQERGPAALREAGLVARLRAAGVDVADHGDRPLVRWRANRDEPNPHNLTAVLDVLRDAETQITKVYAEGRAPLVLGGECTLAVALVSAALGAHGEIGLVYFDGGPDLRTPDDEPSGILDSMGVAHLLDLPGVAPSLAGFGPRRPLLAPERVCFLGCNIIDEPLRTLPSKRFGAPEVTGDPAGSARRAVAAVAGDGAPFVVHFDVDVIDFFDLPVADVPQHHAGLTLADATTVLSTLVHQPGFAGLTVAEFNPDHGAPDGSTARALATALATAVAA